MRRKLMKCGGAIAEALLVTTCYYVLYKVLSLGGGGDYHEETYLAPLIGRSYAARNLLCEGAATCCTSYLGVRRMHLMGRGEAVGYKERYPSVCV